MAEEVTLVGSRFESPDNHNDNVLRSWLPEYRGSACYMDPDPRIVANTVRVGFVSVFGVIGALPIGFRHRLLLVAAAIIIGMASRTDATFSTATTTITGTTSTVTSQDQPCLSFLVVSTHVKQACERRNVPGGIIALYQNVSNPDALSPELRISAAVEHIVAMPGRPYVVNEHQLQADSSTEPSHWCDAPSRADIVQNARKAAEWRRQALGEHASVASFAAFSLQLMVNGAPPALLTAAANAAADEVRHGQQSFALAAMFDSGNASSPTAFPTRAIDSLRSQSLAELAEAALREGGVDETVSVLRAAQRLDSDAEQLTAEEQRVLFGIVQDETRHAVLAWRTVAWESRDNEELTNRLHQVIEELRERYKSEAELFERLIVPLSKRLIGSDDWRDVVYSADVVVKIVKGKSVVQSAIEALLDTFN